MYSYNELVADGCPMDPEWLNPDPSLPPCHDDPDWKGFATAEEAEAAIERSPEDPTCSLVTDPNAPAFMVGIAPTQPNPN